jgi:hypothetical protein
MIFHRVTLNDIYNKIISMIFTFHSCAYSTHCIIINNSENNNNNNNNNVTVIVSTRKLQYLYIRIRYKHILTAELKRGYLVTKFVLRKILML